MHAYAFEALLCKPGAEDSSALYLCVDCSSAVCVQVSLLLSFLARLGFGFKKLSIYARNPAGFLSHAGTLTLPSAGSTDVWSCIALLQDTPTCILVNFDGLCRLGASWLADTAHSAQGGSACCFGGVIQLGCMPCLVLVRAMARQGSTSLFVSVCHAGATWPAATSSDSSVLTGHSSHSAQTSLLFPSPILCPIGSVQPARKLACLGTDQQSYMHQYWVVMPDVLVLVV